MALNNTYNIGFDNSKHSIFQVSRDGSELYRSVDINLNSAYTSSDTWGAKFDDNSNKLIVCTNLCTQIYDVTDNSITLDFEFTHLGTTKNVIRHKVTGKYYTYHGKHVKEWDVDGTFIQDILFNTPYNTLNYGDMHIDYSTNKLILWNGTASSTENIPPNSQFTPEATVDIDTFVLTLGDNFYDYNDSYYNYFFSQQQSWIYAYAYNFTTFNKFNKFDGNMYRFIDNGTRFNNRIAPSCYISKPGKFNEMRKVSLSIGYPTIEEWPEWDKNNIIISIWQGKYSGNFYILTKHLLLSFDVNMNPIENKIRTNLEVDDVWYKHGAKDQESFSFNDVTEEIVVSYFDANYNYIDIFDRHFNLVSTNSFERTITNQISSGPYVVATGAIEETSVETESASVVFPANESLETDLTPHVVFKVGTNPTGWTQQFRLVADRNLNTITAGIANDTYERIYDSWANGVNSGEVFEYCTDYNSEMNPESSGTWAVLGTGDGLQEGGIHIANGIDGKQGQFYVKMTIPEVDALEGVNTADIWYFKVFSYSKFTV